MTEVLISLMVIDYYSHNLVLAYSKLLAYNPYTQSIEILDNKEQIVKLSYDIAQDMYTLTDALQKLK